MKLFTQNGTEDRRVLVRLFYRLCETLGEERLARLVDDAFRVDGLPLEFQRAELARQAQALADRIESYLPPVSWQVAQTSPAPSGAPSGAPLSASEPLPEPPRRRGRPPTKRAEKQARRAALLASTGGMVAETEPAGRAPSIGAGHAAGARRLYREVHVPVNVLAELYDVSYQVMASIIKGETWCDESAAAIGPTPQAVRQARRFYQAETATVDELAGVLRLPVRVVEMLVKYVEVPEQQRLTV